jgi:hypothetical protein
LVRVTKEFRIMWRIMRLGALFTALSVMTPTTSIAQVASQPKVATPRPKLTDEQISDMKFTHYEVERSEIKYQPFIITYDNEELKQLVYDTRQEAQARVDEINTKDRLDKLGVEGKQNKKVGIREVKRTTQETIFKDGLEKVAKKLGVADKERYEAVGKTTHCSEFVRDFAKELLGRSIPELEGKAGDQCDKLKAAAASPDSKWRSLSFSDDAAVAFKNAQDLANEGKLVIVTWKNPHPTLTNSGHIAVIVPSRQEDGGLFDATNRKWKMKVPFIAQAGDEVRDNMPLGDGFGPAKKAGIEVYVLSP